MNEADAARIAQIDKERADLAHAIANAVADDYGPPDPADVVRYRSLTRELDRRERVSCRTAGGVMSILEGLKAKVPDRSYALDELTGTQAYEWALNDVQEALTNPTDEQVRAIAERLIGLP